MESTGDMHTQRCRTAIEAEPHPALGSHEGDTGHQGVWEKTQGVRGVHRRIGSLQENNLILECFKYLSYTFTPSPLTVSCAPGSGVLLLCTIMVITI
jgi:hypothetical protein